MEALDRALRLRGWPPRPLTSEPLAVDLLNTRWLAGDQTADLLQDEALTVVWLAAHGLPGTSSSIVREHLQDLRDALATVVADRHDVAALNSVLDRGRLRLRVTPAGPAEQIDVPDPAWEATWSCARAYLELIRQAPGRARKCANPTCPLHFVDTSRAGTRRWCSMDLCGNRSKVRRHREATRT